MPREPSLFAPPPGSEPLAARMRPRTLEEFLGQEHLLGPGKALGELIRRGEVGSMIFWGPPGSGKTTLAYLIAQYTDRVFVPFSAVTEGVPRVREIIGEAEERLATGGKRTILFCDEIHRFNRAQQDAFLPHVERGTITLIGATTENPSFELTGALLSRARVFVLEPLGEEHLKQLVLRALKDKDRGLDAGRWTLDEDALALLAREADGDARRALSALEAAAAAKTAETAETAGTAGTAETAETAGTAGTASRPSRLTVSDIADALQKRFAIYDKSGEQHFNLISALHKAMRGSDPDAALYWLARMIDGGEDPLYIARRVVRAASEDVGLADPMALQVALAAKDALHFLGQPEGELALAQAVLYVATAPKSNRAYTAWGEALIAAREHPAEGVPLHIRNAPTKLMKEIGYGDGYDYAHAHPEGYSAQRYMPEKLEGMVFYEPTQFGFEKELQKRIEWWNKLKKKAGSQGGAVGDNAS